MNIQKYMAFVQTAAYGSFTKAAGALNYSQSGISRMIGDLEQAWEVSLLERGRTGVRPTSDGLTLLPFAKSVCAEYEKRHMRVDELNGLQLGLIRIDTFSSVATHGLSKIIREFPKSCPNIGYELSLGDYDEPESWILEGRVDCGFLRLPAHADLETIFLEQDRLLAVLPKGRPWADCERFPVNALGDYPFMLLEKGSEADISQVLEQWNITPKAHFTTWDDYAVMSMVESGLGISILPELILQRIPTGLDQKNGKAKDFIVYLQMMAGVWVLNAISLATGVFFAIAKDLENRRVDSFLLTPIRPYNLILSYFLTGLIVSFAINMITWMISAALIG